MAATPPALFQVSVGPGHHLAVLVVVVVVGGGGGGCGGGGGFEVGDVGGDVDNVDDPDRDDDKR